MFCNSCTSGPLEHAYDSASKIPMAIFFGLTVLATIGLAGCSDKPVEINAIDPAASQTASKEESRRKLGSAIQRIQPESMAIQSRRELVVNGLNSWLATSAEGDVEKLKISDANGSRLSPAVLRTASAVRFSENDIVYIRDCLLLKSLTESIWKQTDSSSSSGQATDRDRIVATFRHLVRNVSLLRTDEDRVPVGLYEALLTGRGSVEDRVWAISEALRQRSVDTVVLKAATPGDPTSTDVVLAADTLVGVISGKEILLFDPLRGTAVPKPDDKNAIVLDPAGLEALAGIERWTAATPLVVCHPSAFAPRMLVLQERLDASDSAILYEELAGGTSEIRPLLDRLNDVIGTTWPSDSVKVWDVPEQRIAAAAALTEQQKQQFALLMRPLDSPFERESVNVGNLIDDPNVNQEELTMDQKMAMKMEALDKLLERSDDLFGKPSRRLLITRVQQIMGSFDVGMIQDLQQIRIASLQEKVELEIPVDDKEAMVVPFKLPQAILDVQRNAVGDTLYWTSMTQMSRNDMGAAVATLRNYRRQYPAEKLVFPSLTCEAEALLQLGDSKTAASALQEANVAENPEQLRAQWMLARLTPAAADPSTPEPAATPEPTTPAEPAAPAEPAPQPEPAPAEPAPNVESPK